MSESLRTAVLTRFLEALLPTDAGWIFVSDPNGIFGEADRYLLHGQTYPAVRYRNALQLRVLLESEKAFSPRPPRLVLSQGLPEEERWVRDYVVRAHYLPCTPRRLLETLPPGQRWSIEIDQLTGEDLWHHWLALHEARDRLPETLSSDDCQRLMLSALLERDLLGNWDVVLARRLRQDSGSDPRFTHLHETYPRLARYLETRIQQLIPIEEQAQEDEEFVRFLWTFDALIRHDQPYDLFLPRIFEEDWHRFAALTPETVTDSCTRLVEQDPALMRAQIKQTEEWLTLDSQRFRLFNSCIGIDPSDLSRTLHCLLQERHFCVPIREGLRVLARTLVENPQTHLDPQQLHRLTQHLLRQHRVISEEPRYLRMQEFVELFAWIAELTELLRQFREWEAEAPLRHSLQAWTETLYPSGLSRLEYLRDRIEAANLRHELLAPRTLRDLSAQVVRIIGCFNHLFSKLVRTAYPGWLTGSGAITTDQFWEAILRPYHARYRDVTRKERDGPGMLLIVLERLRWDAWELLRPQFLRTFQGKLALERVIPFLAALPTTHERFLQGLLGEVPDSRDAGEIRFTRSGIRTIYHVEPLPLDRETLLSYSETDLLIGCFSLFHPAVLGTQHKLAALYEHMQHNVRTQLLPWLEELPDDLVILICGDSGMVETEGQGRLWIHPTCDIHRRYLCGPEDAGQELDWIAWEARQIGLGTEENVYRFAVYGHHLAVTDKEGTLAGRYANGGISLQEMIMPCALFAPRGPGQLEMF